MEAYLVHFDSHQGVCSIHARIACLQACISITLDKRTIMALQLDITPASVAQAIVQTSKLKLKPIHIRCRVKSLLLSTTCMLTHQLRSHTITWSNVCVGLKPGRWIRAAQSCQAIFYLQADLLGMELQNTGSFGYDLYGRMFLGVQRAHNTACECTVNAL